jgi:hypothetical protein
MYASVDPAKAAIKVAALSELYSSHTVTGDVYFQSATTEDSCGTDCSASSSPPVLTMSLKYVANEENGSGKLIIYIKVGLTATVSDR